MIKRLKTKFIVIIMVILTIVLFLIFGAINLFMHQLGENQSQTLMQQIVENDGRVPKKHQMPKPKEELHVPLPFDMMDARRYFAVTVSDTNKISLVSEFPPQLSNDEIKELVVSAFTTGKTTGKVSGQRFLIAEKSYGKLIVFVDSRMEDNLLARLLWISIGIGTASLIIVFFIALYLSHWAIRPVQIAFQKQRQFVADASHELKTPLTVIHTNADVLESEIGDNKWLSYIKYEAMHMSDLVGSLLYLAKYDSAENIYEFNQFDLSAAVFSSVLPFESIVFESGKTLNLDITDDIFLFGDERRIHQLITILVDNAIKNSFDDGLITVSLKIRGNKKVLSVHNTGDGINEEEKELVFERFYRSDSSRSRETGGHGLGLAIAKSIVDAHKGKIIVTSKKGEWAEFSVVLP